jgi:predicted dehydrogenase
MIHFALIGLGGMGSRWAGVISKNASLDAVVDPNIKGSPSLEDVLSDKYIDAVLIAVPHKYHASITTQALRAGKHVLCEKPGAIKSGEILKNIFLADLKGLIYMIGYNCRFHDGFVKARKLFEKGIIGNLLFIRARYGFGGRVGYGKEWRINKEMSGGGHLHDQGVHMIDMALSFIGAIEDVKGLRADTYWKSGTEDNGFVLLKGNRGLASIHSSLTQWDRLHEFEIYGTKGCLKVKGLGMRYGEPEKLILGLRTKDPDKVKERVIKCNPIADDSLKLELKEFMSAIKENRVTNPSPIDAYETLKVVEEVYRTNRL